MPVRNGEATLEAALRSVLAQTDPDLEVVVVDDGSTDATTEIATALGAADPRLRLVRRAPSGIVGALNAGLAACRGRYIARMDADDRAVPERLARQIPLLDADPTLAVVDGRAHLFRDEGEVPEGMRRYVAWLGSVCEPEDFDRSILIESPVVHPAATLRRSAVEAIGGYRDGPFPEDYDLWLRLHAAGWRLRKVPEVLVHQRDRPSRLTRTDPRYGRDAFRRARRDYLRRTLLARPRRLWLWATRRERRAWLPWLLAEGHEVVAALDVDPAKVGGRSHSVPVRSWEDLADLDADAGLMAIAVPKGRDEARRAVSRLWPGGVEGRDWWCVT